MSHDAFRKKVVGSPSFLRSNLDRSPDYEIGFGDQLCVSASYCVAFLRFQWYLEICTMDTYKHPKTNQI